MARVQTALIKNGANQRHKSAILLNFARSNTDAIILVCKTIFSPFPIVPSYVIGI